MHCHPIFIASCVALVSASVGAAEPINTRIAVMGTGTATQAADAADIQMNVEGEAATPELAVREMNNRQTRIEAALLGFGLKPDHISTSDLVIKGIRPKHCQDSFSTVGECAATSHIASQQLKFVFLRPDQAGNVVAAAALAGASDPTISKFRILDPQAARKEATARAVEDARGRAEVVAASSGKKLGSLLTLRDDRMYDEIFDEERGRLPNELPIDIPMPAPAKVSDHGVSVRPGAIRTTVNVAATFALIP